LILQLDIGNTRIKWRLVEGADIVNGGAIVRSGGLDLPPLAQVPGQVWVASVAGEELEALLKQEFSGVDVWFARTVERACGVRNSYTQPHRMGVDRWLAMLAAWNQAGDSVCVVDAGSALTIDFVSARGTHLGGYILPGLDSMERALLSDTDRVRFADAARDSLAPGQSTEETVYNGLLLSQAGAVALALDRLDHVGKIYFSGGNGAVLRAALDRGGQHAPDLVLDGLALLAKETLAHCPGQS
jgi:type III pantothenate kinase